MNIFSDFFSPRQKLTLVMLCFTDLCNGLCVSLPAPFYPFEAEQKGASATEYGLVFSAYEFTVFIASPIVGQRLNQIGPKKLLNIGMFLASIFTIILGCLDRIEHHYPFIILSFVTRIMSGLGSAAYTPTSFAIAATEFPNNIATVFAIKETVFGIGLIVGPTLGEALYQLGGYSIPFVTLGCLFLTAAVIISCALPDQPVVSTSRKASVLEILRIPWVFLATCSVVLAAFSVGFMSATLEPHLRQFHLSPMILGLMFVINGGMYGISSPCFGWLCDKKWVSPKAVILLGSCFFVISFSLIAPAPFIHSPPQLSVTIIGLAFNGLGLGACLVAGFNVALSTVIANGFPNNMQTYGLTSSLWTSSVAFGFFVGPSVAGILKDAVGFRRASEAVVAISSIVSLMTAFAICCSSRRKKTYQQLDDFDEFSGAIRRISPSGVKYTIPSL